jgi:hypothetical protein
MTRVELSIRRLVVHGRERFDAKTFGEALRLELVGHLSEGACVASSSDGRTMAPMQPGPQSRSAETDAARTVAGRLFK